MAYFINYYGFAELYIHNQKHFCFSGFYGLTKLELLIYLYIEIY